MVNYGDTLDSHTQNLFLALESHMNIHASIIDQQVTGIMERHSEFLFEEFGNDENKKKSASFVLLCMSTFLDITLEKATELLTEGGQDAGIDGLYLGEIKDGVFNVTLFQGKYKIKDLSGEANFPENGVLKVVNTVSVLFDPFSPHISP